MSLKKLRKHLKKFLSLYKFFDDAIQNSPQWIYRLAKKDRTTPVEHIVPPQLMWGRNKKQ